MTVKSISSRIDWVGAIDRDRRLFDELIPLPNGTSYNSYLVKGDNANALIDTVDPSKKETLFDNLRQSGIEKLDYVIVNHGEQDHSGTLPTLIEKYPECKIVTNQKARDILTDHLTLEDVKFKIIDDGDQLDLGGVKLEFGLIPWVHWPDTQYTHAIEEEVLFTCDFLGHHYATDQLFLNDECELEDSAKRYYAEIMMPFNSRARKNLEKIQEIENEIEIIAPSHGPLHENPENILDYYEEWTSKKLKNKVLIPYVSMHGSTEILVEHLTNALIERDIEAKPYHITKTDIGDIAKELVDSGTIVIGSSTVLGGAHPKALYIAYLANGLGAKANYASIIGSYGWGTKIVDQIADTISSLKLELIEPKIIKGKPNQKDLKLIEEMADKIQEKHRKDPDINSN
ncbi:FprA family A-type flavoprotein [Methanonatronarchaeum sp. AMET-Sl]|uniref:FprA family A-type flavoprotein n=1 Tax=Methanonatronarchaeum sp. AMET-Sl TaxID=3037654 RepID=UPI00244DB808|nr:FprA family A-type flavoprotein [Methanonatronarchaeum sp. AMET-Sl]WGI17025.1 FprA family A-type flavoprotein [Methanonatronarchaeum sp. AMET-Sl]